MPGRLIAENLCVRGRENAVSPPLKKAGECARVPLCKAKAGKKVRVACVEGGRSICARMAALGIYPGAEMQLLCSGCVRVKGGTLSLGEDLSDKILVTPSA